MKDKNGRLIEPNIFSWKYDPFDPDIADYDRHREGWQPMMLKKKAGFACFRHRFIKPEGSLKALAKYTYCNAVIDYSYHNRGEVPAVSGIAYPFYEEVEKHASDYPGTRAALIEDMVQDEFFASVVIVKTAEYREPKMFTYEVNCLPHDIQIVSNYIHLQGDFVGVLISKMKTS